MAVTSFHIDPKTDQTLDDLKRHDQTTSKAEILRKAIALLRVARRSEQDDGSIVMRQRSGQDLQVFVRWVHCRPLGTLAQPCVWTTSKPGKPG